MVAIAQGDVFWADLPPHGGSTAGFRRPVVVVQGDALNRSPRDCRHRASYLDVRLDLEGARPPAPGHRHGLLRRCPCARGIAQPELRASQVTNCDLKGFIDTSQPSLRDQLDVDPIQVPKSTRMAASNRVEINPKVMMGKPVIRGTRITIELILRKLSEGATEGDLLDAYPRLTRADIRAAVTFAADTIAHQETLTIEPLRKRARR